MGLLRDTFKHASVYSLAAIAGRMIGFIMLPFYAHILHDVGYGVIGMFDTTMAFLLTLLAYGLRGSLIRFYHEEAGDAKPRVIGTGILLIGGVSLVLVLPVMLLSRPLTGLLIGDPSKYYLLCMALAGFYLDLVGESASSIMLIRQRSKLFSAVSLLRLFVALSLNIYLIVILRWGLLGYFVSVVATSLVSNSVLVGYAVGSCGLSFSRRIAGKLIRYQAPIIPGSVASYFARQIERVLVRFWIGLADVGVLEMGYKFPPLITLLFARPFMRSWETKRVEIAESGVPEAPRVIGQMFTYFLFVMTFLGLVMAVNVEDLLIVLTPQEFWLAHRIARVEVVSVILTATYMHMAFGLLFMKHTGIYSIINATTSFLKVGLSVLFIKLWGLYGAAFSGCAVAAVRAVWAHQASQRKYRVNFEYGKIALIWVGAVLCFVVLTRVDFSQGRLASDFQAHHLPGIISWLHDTPLGHWKSGKAVVILSERTGYLIDMLGKTLGACLFLLLAPFVHPPWREAVTRRVRSLAGRL